MTLNPHLPDDFESFATDMRVDRHGDPYLAFTVLLYPDRPASVVCLGYEDFPPFDVTEVTRRKKDEDEDEGDERTSALPVEDLERAGEAIGDIVRAIGHHRVETDMPIKEFIRAHMQEWWDRRQMAPIAMELALAEREAAMPAVCEFCNRRFATERGLATHQRDCYHNPAAKRYAASGDMEPIYQDGKIVGAQMKTEGREPCTRCPDRRSHHVDDGPCQKDGCACKRFVGAALEQEANAQ